MCLGAAGPDGKHSKPILAAAKQTKLDVDAAEGSCEASAESSKNRRPPRRERAAVHQENAVHSDGLAEVPPLIP